MSFFNPPKGEEDSGQTLAAAMAARFGYPCTYYPPAKDVSSILSDYREAREQGKTESFVPMLLSEEYVQGLLDGTLEPPEQSLVPSEAGQDVLQRRLEEAKQAYAEYGGDSWEEEVIGEVSGGEAVDRFLSLWDSRKQQTVPMVLARIPVKNPWEVFTRLPFGGWNECPEDSEQMAVAKYWFEEYGAVPALMTLEVLEYVLPAPVSREKALNLALEQYAFCTDIVDQGVQTVGRLADGLALSDHWFFWWD